MSNFRSLFGLAGIALAALMLPACTDRNGPPAQASAGPPTLAELARIEDLNPDPGIIEINLEARTAEVEYLPGKKTEAWTYNGTVPGPLVEAKVGDQLRVHFVNNLPESTTIHWHGLRLPAEMDGSQSMQAPVPPGGSYEYIFTLQDAGLFWFHPHIRSDVQVEKGLYGTLLVRPNEGEPPLGRERIVILDDVLVNADGSLVGEMGEAMEMTGRIGNVLLANGTENAHLEVTPGERLRLRLVNVSNSRYYRLAVPGRPMWLVGTDGGTLPAPHSVEEVLLTPAERVDLLLDVDGAPGDTVELQSLPYERGHETGKAAAATVLTLRLGNGAGAREPLPAALREIPELPAPVRSRALVLTEEHGESQNGSAAASGPVFKINGEAFPNVTPLSAALGETEDWSIVNETEMDHPFHLHGFFFQVQSVRDVPPLYRSWKDTVNIPAKTTVRFRVRYEGFPGMWMFHCHILEHGERGMMGHLNVAP